MPLLKPRRPRAPRVCALDSNDAAARRLAVADCSTAAPLLARLCQETDDGVRHAILTRLGALTEEAIEAQLVALLGSEEVALRNDALLALRRRGDAALPALEAALAGPDPDVRVLAASVLEGIATPAARAALAARLPQEADAAVCLALVEALAQIGTPQEAPALAALRARFAGEPSLCFAVGLALDEIGAGA
jgi:HEAT repeat protein